MLCFKGKFEIADDYDIDFSVQLIDYKGVADSSAIAAASCADSTVSASLGSAANSVVSDLFSLGLSNVGDYLVANARVKSHEGVFKSSTPVGVLFRWSNAFSWARSKELHFSITCPP